MKRKWFDKKVIILGLSKSGISAAKYLVDKGADCYITEGAENPKNQDKIAELQSLGIKVETGGHSDEFLSDAYVAITSPGIPPHSDLFKKLQEKNIPIMSEIELAFKESDAPLVAITGTNGKTTTTCLAEHILSGEYKAPACGNIGVPPTSLLNQKNDYLVCEVSSFQIATSPTLKPQIACWLNFTPDHIDWHQGLENYFKAKALLFASHKLPAFAVFNAADPKVFEFGEQYTGEKFYFSKEFDTNCCFEKDDAIWFKRKNTEKIIDFKDIPLVGEHNYQNIMCAVIIAKIIGMENEAIKNKIMSFKAVEHRIEYVTTINGKAFYNDSKATNPEASLVALKAFPNKNMTLIAGGRDKNTDLQEFCDSVNKNVKDVILIGEATNRFKENLEKNDFNHIYTTDSMESAIDKSIELGNEIVLLSPACASFDMFDGYEHRGDVFKKYVLSKV
ncbi:MAG: UDP-N-acetylmuramoyl-L-alanine--D-glutamate ligase [Candidatus Gastranaerophilales bacterium]|nr:UDP-N-acetylmuramoyl-L-alanine--D-glutamate ligase [Candidatus Gastranaerophilales bacterium]